jgi:hypothetical protein
MAGTQWSRQNFDFFPPPIPSSKMVSEIEQSSAPKCSSETAACQLHTKCKKSGALETCDRRETSLALRPAGAVRRSCGQRPRLLGVRWRWKASRRNLCRRTLAVDAVLIGPVSTPEFPDNREINREYWKFWPSAAICASNWGVKSKVYNRIPYATEQGIVLA